MPLRCLLVLFAAQLAMPAALWASLLVGSSLSQWLYRIGWTQTCFGSVSRSWGTWQDELALLFVPAALLLFVQYGLVLLGGKLFHGRLRLRWNHLLRAWLLAAVLALLAIGVATTGADLPS